MQHSTDRHSPAQQIAPPEQSPSLEQGLQMPSMHKPLQHMSPVTHSKPVGPHSTQVPSLSVGNFPHFPTQQSDASPQNDPRLLQHMPSVQVKPPQQGALSSQGCLRFRHPSWHLPSTHAWLQHWESLLQGDDSRLQGGPGTAQTPSMHSIPSSGQQKRLPPSHG
jgi:hypothetical protein